jgi:hypothetical protein
MTVTVDEVLDMIKKMSNENINVISDELFKLKHKPEKPTPDLADVKISKADSERLCAKMSNILESRHTKIQIDVGVHAVGQIFTSNPCRIMFDGISGGGISSQAVEKNKEVQKIREYFYKQSNCFHNDAATVAKKLGIEKQSLIKILHSKLPKQI